MSARQPPSTAIVPDFEFDAYLSYPRAEREWKDRLEHELSLRGLRCFSDSRLRAGDQIGGALDDGLRRSRALIVLWSRDAASSANLMAEVGAFRALRWPDPADGRRIVVVYLGGDSAVRSAPDLLREVQGIVVPDDVYADPPDTSSAGFGKLVDLVVQAIERPGGGARAAGSRPSSRASQQSGHGPDRDALWNGLSDGVRRALSWARAGEAELVGTRALLFGLMKMGGGSDPLGLLLSVAGSGYDELVAALEELPPRGEFRPAFASEPADLDGLPVLTVNAWRVLNSARVLAQQFQSVVVGPDHLLGALLAQPGTTAYSGLMRITGSVELARAGDAFMLYLRSPDEMDLRAAFERALVEPRAFYEGTPADADGVRPATAVANDRWTTEDFLNHRVYAEAIARFIRNPNTRAPLAIGLKAPWGAGKTSTMRMVRDALDPAAGEEHRRVRAERLSIWEVLRKTRADPETAAGELEPARGDPGTRTTIWFNAWKYQSREQIWAGLAHAILTQLEERLSAVNSDRLWASLQVRRASLPELRRRFYRYVLLRALPHLVGALLAVILVVVAALVVPGIVIPSLVVVGLAALNAVRGFVGGFQDDVQRAAPSLVEAPDYESRVGYLHLVDSDLRRILHVAGATPERPFVVFVDDLDRCAYTTVAEVIEALNVFLAGDFENCVFVIAMEPDLIAAQLHVAHRDLFEQMGEDGRDLGWRFLEKMIQLPLSLPGPAGAQLERFVGSLTGASPDFERVAAVTELDDEDSVVAMREQLRAAGDGESLDGVVEAAERLQRQSIGEPSGGAAELLAEAASRELDARLDDPAAREIILRHARTLAGTPREIKRFVNVFRFYAHVDLHRRLNGLPAVGAEGAAKLARLAVGWPSVAGALTAAPARGEPSLLAQLENAPDDGVWERLVAAAPNRLRSALSSSGELRAVIAAEPHVGTLAGSFV